MVKHFANRFAAVTDLFAHGFGVSLKSGWFISADHKVRASIHPTSGTAVCVFYSEM